MHSTCTVVVAVVPSVAFATVMIMMVTMVTTTTCEEEHLQAVDVITQSVDPALVLAATKYADELQELGVKNEIGIQTWMHDGDQKLNGCGFYVRADGYDADGNRGSITSDRDFLPPVTLNVCNDGKYRMRITLPGAKYSMWLRPGANRRGKLHAELHADGWQDTFVKMVCVGFVRRPVVGGGGGGGPRAFCVDNDVLRACKSLLRETDGWPMINTDDIKLTRTTRGAHRIVFRNVDELADGFERLKLWGSVNATHVNATHVNATHAICDRIELVRGDDKEEWRTCSGYKFKPGLFDKSEFIAQEKMPYGCSPIDA